MPPESEEVDQKPDAGAERALRLLMLKSLEVEAGSDSHNRGGEVDRLLHGFVKGVGQEFRNEVDFIDQRVCELGLKHDVCGVGGGLAGMASLSGVAHVR